MSFASGDAGTLPKLAALLSRIWRRPARAVGARQAPSNGVDLFRLGQNCALAKLSETSSDRILNLVVGAADDEARRSFAQGRLAPPESPVLEDVGGGLEDVLGKASLADVLRVGRDEGWTVDVREGEVSFRILGGFSARFRDEDELAEHVARRARTGSVVHMRATRIARLHVPAFYALVASSPEPIPAARFKEPSPEDETPPPFWTRR